MDVIDISSMGADSARFTKFLLSLCDSLELDHASYASLNDVADSIQGTTTYPTTWQKHYTEKQLFLFDPAIHQAARSIVPVDWDRLNRDDGFDKVFRRAHDFGIASRGLTVPIRGPYGDFGLLSVTRGCSDGEWTKLKRHIMGDLQQAAVHIHDAVMQSGVLSAALRRPVLSAREVEILQWCAMGKAQQDIADILNISHRTVEVHLRSARTKLGALTTAQAVGRGIARRLIEPG